MVTVSGFITTAAEKLTCCARARAHPMGGHPAGTGVPRPAKAGTPAGPAPGGHPWVRMNAAQSFKRIFLKIPRASCPRIKIRDSFIAKEDGDVAVAMMLFMMMLCVLAVIGYDFSRAPTPCASA